MITRICLALLLVLLPFGTRPGAADPSPSVTGESQFAPTTCKFDDPGGTFKIEGTAREKKYLVAFPKWQGKAVLERHDQFWPGTFEMKITGVRDTILSVSLTPGGCKQMSLLALPGKKWVQYFDEHGKWLDKASDTAFRFETEETDQGMEVKVTLPKTARSMRRLTVDYYSTCW
jgi:hypothetical protein